MTKSIGPNPGHAASYYAASARDKRVRGELEQRGWRVVTLWECEAAEEDGLRRKLKAIFRS